MARKRVNAGLANGAASQAPEVPQSPATSGAMDSLLEKLRAAAPQARDQRDRRRRARLKDKHLVRVASEQNLGGSAAEEVEDEVEEDEPSIIEQDNAEKEEKPIENGQLRSPSLESRSGSMNLESQTDGDVADRAASMLQGLRSSTETDDERLRRQRGSAEEERRSRRMRRRNGTGSVSKDSTDGAALSPVRDSSPSAPPASL